MFYFMRDKRFDTGTDEYSDLNECVDSIMKAQLASLCPPLQYPPYARHGLSFANDHQHVS
jgi:hypothetical protein